MVGRVARLLVVVAVWVVVGGVRADLGRPVVHHLRLWLRLMHHHVAVEAPHHRRGGGRVVMEPLHACHEVAVLLLLEVLLLKPSIPGGGIGWVAEAACVSTRSSTARPQAMVQAHQATDATGVLLSTIPHLGICRRRHVHLLILVVVVLMVVARRRTTTTTFLAVDVALVIVDIGTVAILVLDIGGRSSSLLPEDAKLAHLVPKEAEVVLVVIVKLVVIFVIIIHVIVLRAQLGQLVLVVLALEGLEALYEAPNSTMLAALVLLADVAVLVVVAILAWVGGLLLMLLLLGVVVVVAAAVALVVALVVAAAALVMRPQLCVLAPSGELPDERLGVHIASHRDLVVVHIDGHRVDTFNLLEQLLHLVPATIAVYVHPQDMGLDLDQLEILIFGHSAVEHPLLASCARLGWKWRREDGAGGGRGDSVGGNKEAAVASGGVGE